MPQSLSNILIHVIFSTKDRFPFLSPEIRTQAHAYLATVARNAGCEAYQVGGVADHVHLAVRLSRTVTMAALLEELKTASSKWIKTQSPELNAFSWQRGYGAFSLSPEELPALLHYINTQDEHHRITSFQEEYREVLKKHGVDYDERYLWD